MGRSRRAGIALGLSGVLLALTFVSAKAWAWAGEPALPPRALTQEALDSIPAESRTSPRKILEALRNGGRSSSPRVGNLCGNGLVACYFDGVIENYPLYNCDYGGTYSPMSAYSGFFVADDLSYPATGDTYWGHVLIGTTAGCVNDFSARVGLPGNAGATKKSEFAFSNALSNNEGKIRCLLHTIPNSGPEIIRDFTGLDGVDAVDTNLDNVNDTFYPYECYSRPLLTGALGHRAMAGSLSQSMMLELIFPIRTKQPLLSASNAKLIAIANANLDELAIENLVFVQQGTLRASASRAGSKIRVSGKLGPASSVRSTLMQQNSIPGVTVTLKGRKGGSIRTLASKSVKVGADGSYSHSFARPRGASSCRVSVSYGESVTANKSVGC